MRLTVLRASVTRTSTAEGAPQMQEQELAQNKRARVEGLSSPPQHQQRTGKDFVSDCRLQSSAEHYLGLDQ